jgi:AraC family transcriptional regulator
VPAVAKDVEAELRTARSAVQLVRYRFAEPPKHLLRPAPSFRLECCLNAQHRSARASYRDQWSGRRFERVGDVFLLPPTLDMIVASDETSPIKAVVCELGRETLLELYDDPPTLTEEHLTASLDIRDPRVRALMLRLAEEARAPGFASELMLELAIGQLAIQLRRHGASIAGRSVRGGLASWQLRAIDERLGEVAPAPSLAALAQLCRISTRQLARGFRASKDISVGAYVAQSQMEHAKRLIGQGMTLADIVQALGFSSTSNFCTAFRRATGVTPGQYRRTGQRG